MLDMIKPEYEKLLFSSEGEQQKLALSYRVYPLKTTELVLACSGASLVVELGEMLPEMRLGLADYLVSISGVVLHQHCMQVLINVANKADKSYSLTVSFSLGESGLGEVRLDNELKGNYPFYKFIPA